MSDRKSGLVVCECHCVGSRETTNKPRTDRATIAPMVIVYDHGHCVRPWSLCTTMVIVYDHGHCVRPWSLCTTMVIVYDHGHCVRPWSLCTTMVIMYDHSLCIMIVLVLVVCSLANGESNDAETTHLKNLMFRSCRSFTKRQP